MGFLEIAAAFKFLSNVDLVWGWQTVSRTMVLAAWVALAIITAIYLLGKFQLPYDSKVERLGVARMLSATFFLAMAFYLLTGLFGGKLGELDAFLPPDSATPSVGFASSGGNVAGPTGKWIENYEKGLEQARLTKKPIFVNFTGVTCTNCRWMEQNMFPLPPVKKELDRFVLVELFTDRETPEDERNGQLQESRFMTVALPLYVILDPEGNELGQFPGLTRNRDEFVAFLQAGASRFNQVASR
jgi:thiol:disulfide interchange protein